LTKYEESQPEERRSVSLIHQNSHFTQEKIWQIHYDFFQHFIFWYIKLYKIMPLIMTFSYTYIMYFEHIHP
jgi:hypothetical protein